MHMYFEHGHICILVTFIMHTYSNTTQCFMQHLFIYEFSIEGCDSRAMLQ
ncbi:hypothetical protein SLEP1_g26669 [Rubroshorea leprosula]|uniref:Uncharacterized protein n=1 Tax=Rubroshorea leprosula TaxID=152421 RepID=A0AAV5JU55_9ROSI|nr:hypothetical protein SLEP1_g26669 [Rubroshorea leprosula]